MSATKLSSNYILRSLHERKALPMFPAIIVKLDEALSREHISIDQVVSIVAADMMIAARVMKAASGIRYGVKPPIDLLEAVSRLGFSEVRAVAFAVAYSAGFMRPTHVNVGAFWRHAFASAVAAREVAAWFMRARHQRVCDGPTAFLLGLSHEVGVLLLDLYQPDAFDKVLADVKAGSSQSLSEQRVLGTTHAIIGAALLKHWAFADHMAMAVAAHHFPVRLQPELQPLADVVFFAEVLAYRLGYDNSVTPALDAATLALWHDRCQVYAMTDAVIDSLQESIEHHLVAEGWLELADSVAG